MNGWSITGHLEIVVEEPAPHVDDRRLALEIGQQKLKGIEGILDYNCPESASGKLKEARSGMEKRANIRSEYQFNNPFLLLKRIVDLNTD